LILACLGAQLDVQAVGIAVAIAVKMIIQNKKRAGEFSFDPAQKSMIHGSDRVKNLGIDFKEERR
jgi:hypothetical protein